MRETFGNAFMFNYEIELTQHVLEILSSCLKLKGTMYSSSSRILFSEILVLILTPILFVILTISACNKHVIFSLAWLGRNWKMAAVCMHTVKTLIEIIGYKVYKTEKESQNSPLWGTDYTHFWVWCSDIVLLFVSQIMNNGSFRQDPMKILAVTRELKYLYLLLFLARKSQLIDLILKRLMQKNWLLY